MIDEGTVAAIQEALVPVAEKIGEGVGMAWELLVWGQFAEGLASLVVSVVMVIAALYTIKKGYHLAKAQHDAELATVIFVGTGCLAVIGVLTIAFTNWTWMIIQIMAPEYATFMYLLTLVG